MFIASTCSDHGDFLLLGLSAENITRLQAGLPIRITRATHGLAVPAKLTVAIITGDTERSIEADLRQQGLIGATTVMNARQPS